MTVLTLHQVLGIELWPMTPTHSMGDYVAWRTDLFLLPVDTKT